MTHEVAWSDPQSERLHADWQELSTFRDGASPGWTRRPFTAEYRDSREWLRERMVDAGLETDIDAGGNLIGRRAGLDARLPPIVLGSHTDTVLGGGRFDGIVGVLGSIELVRCLADSNRILDHSLEVTDFLAEEPTDFGISMVGSRAIAGTLSREMLERRDKTGKTLREAITLVGGRPDEIDNTSRQRGSVACYLELHIEQGSVLERAGSQVGIVTAITGVTRLRIDVTGRADHAGGTSMSERRDALTMAAEIILQLEKLWQNGAGVGTIGRLDVSPNAANVVPGRVELWADMRSLMPGKLEATTRMFVEDVRHLAHLRDGRVNIDLLSHEIPVVCANDLQNRLEAAAGRVNAHSRRLPSYAGHDATQMAKIAPTGMLFVPSRAGRSHCPEEWTDLSDVVTGVRVLGEAILDFDQSVR